MLRKAVCVALCGIFVCSLLAACSGGEGAAGPTYSSFYLKKSLSTNLIDSRRILNCEPVIEVSNEAMLEVLTAKEYLVTDTIIKILRELTESEFKKPGIQDELQEKIKTALVESFGDEGESIHRVYFASFAAQ